MLTESYLRLVDLIGDRERGIPAIVPLSRATVYKRIREGRFPQPVKLGQRASAFRRSEVESWLENPTGWQLKK